jgi:hypothetical protein
MKNIWVITKYSSEKWTGVKETEKNMLMHPVNMY